ncbi:carbohydrate ABC transporter substrate-binding protein, CUT1 family [Rhodoferax sp. OV413]|uniref:ABC transporter substrate-binding protein n=1 Tax=Rhodoferax sp. OV413 TaxID=1855285 RepID=UPI00088BB448|nr:carbohydrate ABC transporter substrate-binding protein, CUT1 family [Rhodoferax sp. OV413]
MQQHTRTVLALAATALAVLAGSNAHAQAKAEVMHWWTSGGESAAVQELAGAFTKSGGVWVDSAVAGGENARAAAINRIVGGNPPTAAMFNTSQQYLDIIKEGMLNDIDAVAAKEGWDKMLPAPIINSIKVNGHYYAAPVNIHMPSWFWYSKAAFAKAGIAAEPKTPDEMFAALDKLKAAGLIPLALGGQGWQEVITFYSWLAQAGGADLYLKFYKDRDAATVNSPAFRKVLADFKRLKSYTDAGSPGRNWNDSTSLVITGKAGVQIMGDWAKGEFANAKQVAGKDFGCFPGFGAKSPYILAGDVFVFPRTKDPAAIKAQQQLATSMTSAATQVAFNNKKGSIPIRTDVDSSKMDLCAQTGLAIMKDTSRHLANPDALLPPDVMGSVQDVISKYWNNNQSVDDVVKALQNAIKS